MKFYAIAFLYEEDVYFDLELKDDVLDLKSTCFLPTKEMAQQYIDEELSNQYVPVEIELESLNNDVLSWSRGTVLYWDE